jgi:hypothetical protein
MSFRVLICLIAISSAASAASSRVVPSFEMHAKMEKKNAVLDFKEGAVAALLSEKGFDSIQATTADFPGGRVPAFLVMADTVSEEKLRALAVRDGFLEGSVHCKRIRLGSSPQFPLFKSAVLGEQCTIKALNE